MGSGTSPRPSSSSTTISSVYPRPAPPCAARELQLVVGEAVALPAERLRPGDADGEVAAALVQLGTVIFEDRCLGARRMARLHPGARAGERPVEARLVHLELGDLVAHDRLADAAVVGWQIAAGRRQPARGGVAPPAGGGRHVAPGTQPHPRAA